MRILALTPLMLLAAACNVQTDGGNNQVTVQYDGNEAQNVASDVGNTARDMGNAVANEADETAAKVNNSGIVTQDDDDQNQASNSAENKQ